MSRASRATSTAGAGRARAHAASRAGPAAAAAAAAARLWMLSTYAVLLWLWLSAICCLLLHRHKRFEYPLPYLLKEEVICVSSPQEKGREEKGRVLSILRVVHSCEGSAFGESCKLCRFRAYQCFY